MIFKVSFWLKFRMLFSIMRPSVANELANCIPIAIKIMVAMIDTAVKVYLAIFPMDFVVGINIFRPNNINPKNGIPMLRNNKNPTNQTGNSEKPPLFKKVVHGMPSKTISELNASKPTINEITTDTPVNISITPINLAKSPRIVMIKSPNDVPTLLKFPEN